MRVPRSVAALLVLLALVAFALAKEFRPAPAGNAESYAAHDTHAQEHVSVAVDPYDTNEKLAGAKIDYRRQQLLPVRLVITNNSEAPISFVDLSVQLIESDRTKLDPATMDDLMRRISSKQKNPQQMGRSPWPIPKIGAKPAQRVKSDQLDELQTLMWEAKAVEPHATQSGFVFFDVQDIAHPLEGARMLVQGLRTNSGGELMYFEVPLDQGGGRR